MSAPDDSFLLSVVQRIQMFPELEGCQIGYYGDNYAKLLNASYSESIAASSVAIVIERLATSNQSEIAEVRSLAAQPGGSPDRAPNPTLVTNRSRLGPELIGAGWNCGLTIGSVLMGVGGVAAEVPTGGASSFLVVASWMGVVTGGTLCLNGLVRVTTALVEPESNSLEEWDNNSWYSDFSLAVDGLGVVAGLTSLPFAVRNLWAVIARQRAFVARNLTLETLRAMSRKERMTTMRAVLEEAGRTQEGREAILNAMREARLAPEVMARENLTVRSAQSLRRIVSDETIKRLRASLLEVFLNLGTHAGSASPASATGSASGSINWIIHVMDANQAN